MKAKKLLALLLTFVMVVSLLPVNALALEAEQDFQIDVKLTEETLAGHDGVSVKVELTSGADTTVGMVMLGLSYDTDVFEAIDSDGAVVKLPSDEGKARPKLQVMDRTNMVLLFNTFNTTYAMQVEDNTATVVFGHANFSDIESGETDKYFTTATLIDQLFLAFKDGKSIADVTSDTIRLASNDEVTATKQYDTTMSVLTSVVSENDDGDLTADNKSWNYGCEDSSQDTAGAKEKIDVITTNFEFAKEKPVCAAPAAVVSEYGEKLGSITLTNPAGNTAGTWTWDKPETVLDAVGTKTYTATFTPADSAAYQTVSGVEIEVSVVAKALEGVSVGEINDQGYTGEAIKPTVTVTDKTGLTLVEGTDYTVTYENNINVGVATVTVKAVEGGNYTFADVKGSFNIAAAASELKITSDISKTYDGVAVLAPDYSVEGSTQEAVIEYYSDAECTTKIDAPADAGTYYVKVSVAADDNYGAAFASVSFTIKAADYTYTYAGSTASNVGKSYPETSAATAEGVDGESVKGTLSWYTNKQCTTAASGSFTKVGSTTLYWKFTPDAEETNYVATAKTGSVTFTVSALPVQVFADGFAGTVEKTYGDEAFTRAAALTTGTGAITYKSSNEAVATVDGDGKVTILAAGTATITATAALVETEWAETPVSYTLTVAKKAVTVTVDAAERAYGEENPVFTAKAEGLVGADTVEGLELGLKTSATAKSNVGTYDVVGDGSYNKNYDVTILGTGALTVKKAVWSGSIAEQQIRSKFAFTGEKAVDFPAGLPADKGTTTYTLGEVSDASAIFASAPVVDAATGKMTLNLAGKDAYVENMSAAVAVKVTMQNYEDVTVSFVVTLIDKEAVEASAKDITVTYTGEAVSDSKISGTATFEGKKVNGTWAFKAEQGLTNVADSGAKIVVFTPEDSVNYATAEVTINVTINKAKVTGSPAYTRINEKDKTLADAALGVGTLAPEGGTIRWKDKDGNTLDDTTVVTVNAGYTWEYTPVDTANYEIATGTLTPYSVSSGGGSTTKSEVKVEETDGGEVKVSTEKAAKGKTVTVEVEPDMGFKVVNVRVYDAKGNEITVTQNASGEYTFVMPEGKVRVEAEFAEETVELPFTDVDEDAWYYDSVAYVYEKGLMNGTAADKFSPAVSTTRGMIVTILYNLEGKPAAGTAAFEDVSADTWYAKSVAWAAENGIVTGYGGGKFGPEDTITREQFAAILFRYAKLKGYDVSVGENTNILSYTDALSSSEYAIPAMQWACGAGLINGVTESTLAPTGSATRAQAAKILMMFCQNVAQ